MRLADSSDKWPCHQYLLPQRNKFFIDMNRRYGALVYPFNKTAEKCFYGTARIYSIDKPLKPLIASVMKYITQLVNMESLGVASTRS